MFRYRRFLPALVGGIRYLLRDEFTTDLAAGSVNGTAAEPGPGVRAVVDTENKLSLSGGYLTFASGKASPAYGDPGLWEGAITRTAGKMVIGAINLSTLGYCSFIGYGTGQSGATTESLKQYSTSKVQVFCNGGALTIDVAPSLVVSTSYRGAVILKTTGTMFFIKGGIYSNWTLLYINSLSNTATLYPACINYNAVFTSDFIRIPTTLWLPTPLLSDGFGGTWPMSDGLGHAEGIAGGIGAGGGGLTWTVQLGTWEIAAGVASSSALDASGISIATATLNTADAWYSCILAYSAGNAGVIVRYADAANYSYIIHDGTNVKLFEVTTAAPYPGTQRGTTIKAPAAGARLIIDASGATIRIYYNEALMFVYASAVNTTATKIGLITSNVNNTFNDAVAYAKGTGGEYSVLDKYSN